MLQESNYSFQLWVKLSRTDDGYPLIGMLISKYYISLCVSVCPSTCVLTCVSVHVHVYARMCSYMEALTVYIYTVAKRLTMLLWYEVTLAWHHNIVHASRMIISTLKGCTLHQLTSMHTHSKERPLSFLRVAFMHANLR